MVTVFKGDEEYLAKAMLLDMEYQLGCHAFSPKRDYALNGGVAWHGKNSIWFDADTMEPLNWEQRMQRRKERGYGLPKQD